MEFITNSMEETMSVASEFSKTLSRGDIVLLDGDLGAGKTVFVKGVASALSGDKVIAVSPTFLILNEYDTMPPIYHFDLYRINDISELDAIGAEEYFYGDGISFVEWPERAGEMFPSSSIKVFIEKLNENSRRIRIER